MPSTVVPPGAVVVEPEGAAGGDGAAPPEGAGSSSSTEGAGSTAGGSAPPESDKERGAGLSDDPATLKAEILRLRDESASNRVNAKKTAAEEARKAVIQEFGKALGFIKDEDAEKLSVGELTKKVSEATAETTDTKRELAIFKLAMTEGADPNKLLDSRSFLSEVKGIEYNDSDKLKAAIKKAVDGNPTFKLVQVTGASSVDHAGGSGEKSGKAKSLSQAVADHYGS